VLPRIQQLTANYSNAVGWRQRAPVLPRSQQLPANRCPRKTATGCPNRHRQVHCPSRRCPPRSNGVFSTKYAGGENGPMNEGHEGNQPSTGRGLSRESLREGGGVNQYGFVGNNPEVIIDSSGLAWWWPPSWFEKKRCCCCCVEDLSIDPNPLKSKFRPFTPAQWWNFLSQGVSGEYRVPYSVKSTLSYVTVGNIEDGRCKITWKETWVEGTPWYDPTASHNSSYDLSNDFQHYFNNTGHCPGPKKVSISDAPGASWVYPNTSFTMYLIIDITVSSSADKNCVGKCEKLSKTALIEIKMKMSNGQPDYSYEHFSIAYP
jgi:hypothetical protein